MSWPQLPCRAGESHKDGYARTYAASTASAATGLVRMRARLQRRRSAIDRAICRAVFQKRRPDRPAGKGGPIQRTRWTESMNLSLAHYRLQVHVGGCKARTSHFGSQTAGRHRLSGSLPSCRTVQLVCRSALGCDGEENRGPLRSTVASAISAGRRGASAVSTRATGCFTCPLTLSCHCAVAQPWRRIS